MSSDQAIAFLLNRVAVLEIAFSNLMVYYVDDCGVNQINHFIKLAEEEVAKLNIDTKRALENIQEGSNSVDLPPSKE